MKMSEQVTWDTSMPRDGCKLWDWWQSWIDSLSWKIFAEKSPTWIHACKSSTQSIANAGHQQIPWCSAALTPSYDKRKMIWCWDAPTLQELGSTRPLDESVPTSEQQQHLAPCSATPRKFQIRISVPCVLQHLRNTENRNKHLNVEII